MELEIFSFIFNKVLKTWPPLSHRIAGRACGRGGKGNFRPSRHGGSIEGGFAIQVSKHPRGFLSLYSVVPRAQRTHRKEFGGHHGEFPLRGGLGARSEEQEICSMFFTLLLAIPDGFDMKGLISESLFPVICLCMSLGSSGRGG